MTAAPAEIVPLATLDRGAVACVECCDLESCRAQLEALGLDRDARVSVCRRGDPFIIRVDHPCGGSCRIGIRRAIGERIMVRPIND